MKDFFQECYADKRGDLDEKTFREVFCAHCRNPECVLAGWGFDKFGERISTQADRLLHPKRMDPKHYPHLANFRDMLERAIQLNLAEQKGDWSVPEIPILDGKNENASVDTTTAVDGAARTLAESRGKEFNPPVSTPKEVPEQSPDEQEMQRHDPPEQNKPKEKASGKSSPLGPNTVTPEGGIMVGDDDTPASPTKPDPWTVSPVSGKVVKPGTRIRLGGKKQNE